MGEPPTDSVIAAAPRTQAAAIVLVDECFDQFRGKLTDIARGSIEMSGDLFEGNEFVKQTDVDEFKLRRNAWLERFDAALRELYAKRMAGGQRKGRRPDFDASVATLRVLTAFDQEKQAALVQATSFLLRLTRRELDALDLRVDALLAPGRPVRDIDNPFSPVYVLDAIGLSARGIYPNPRIWRPFMERVVGDLTPAIHKVYITLNRFLADRGVLPEIKAELRARSELRPADDRDLIPTFSRMLHEAGQSLSTDVVVPNLSGDLSTSSVFDFAAAGERAAQAVAAILPSAVSPSLDGNGNARASLPAPVLVDGLTELNRQVPARAETTSSGDALFPDLDPLMALGASTPLFNTLAHWQRIDLPSELAKLLPAAAAAGGAAVVPLNLIPHIRAAVGSQIANPTDRITMDVIALLFDYVFRDASIPEDLRNVFGRLQVPVLKAALLDRTFFSDRAHPARKLLDHLADAAIGATHDPRYRSAFESQATGVVDRVCADFEIDVKVFAEADATLVAFMETERQATDEAVQRDVSAALAVERRESHRTQVRALVRDKLAGLELPFEVRGFVETVWSDFLAAVSRKYGVDGEAWLAGVRTLDDLLWSIVAKERTAQKARLTKMIPALVLGLRKGCAAVNAPAERSQAFFDALYPLHVAAIKPREKIEADDGPSSPQTIPAAVGTARGRPQLNARNVHDFVNEMAVGTWMSIKGDDGNKVNARLTWVSPLRTKYIFTSRSRGRAFMFTPEELAWEINAGNAALVLEPVPLFDRAVSAALDTLAAQKPRGSEGAAQPAADPA
ncbi:MAG TPA: DUF1631 family protein [Casimicrobiaceae bacterium]|nr:DUF1631 family protein [Casimicrobiaceae bacterium]